MDHMRVAMAQRKAADHAVRRMLEIDQFCRKNNIALDAFYEMERQHQKCLIGAGLMKSRPIFGESPHPSTLPRPIFSHRFQASLEVAQKVSKGQSHVEAAEKGHQTNDSQ